ncbi:MAG: CBS domain-containing protein [Candidatus Omnitrophica bacterium]|nr:CBS domain-containing protein [Candidatus Omnitrophota bacterium]
MDLIVTHKNADFDALSSLVAASKLYPKARLLLPGSQEKAVRNFLSLIKDKIRIENEKTCRMDDVTRLIIVDNRHRSRIGEAAGLLDKKGIKVHIYDHHPRTSSDIKADKEVYKQVGATVTLLLEILAKKGKLKLTPLEATLMLLGIYEETGSLSYSPTTKLDVDIVSMLLDQGANLNAVSSYLNRELTETELSIFVDLLESVEVYNVHGINVAFASVEAKHFAGEMGTVVHKLQDVENQPVFFVLFKTPDKVKIMARSRVELIDVNKMMAHFDGAGHSSAASARTEGRSVEQIKDIILGKIKRITRTDVYAKDIMSKNVETVSQEEKIDEVFRRLKDSGYKGMPVYDQKSKLVGMITMGDMKKAIKRGMGHSRVKGYMSTPLVTVSPETPLHDLQQIMIDSNKGRLPVIKKGRLVGIVSRTDVLKKVHSALFRAKPEKRVAVTDIIARMNLLLPKKFMKLIRSISDEADKRGIELFVVGGFVRDLLLGRKNYDLDIVIEGDAIAFGRVVADKLKGAFVVHKKFGTSTIVMDWPSWLGPALHPDNKFKIDVATARQEVYEAPAALPTVKFSSLREDLYRRDFTINAMAIKINKKDFGLFLDFFDGIKDLNRGIIRALHDKSFIDDPTRIFRAVRFEQRFGFQIEKHTEYLIKHAVKQEMFRRTENQRIRDELVLILKEKDPEKPVFRMRELHELRFIHPELVLKSSIRRHFRDLKHFIHWYNENAAKRRNLDVWLMNLMVVIDKLSLKQLEVVLEKFVFKRSESTRLRSCKKDGDRAIRKLSSRKKMKPSEVYDILEPFAHEVTLFIMSKTTSKTVRRRIKKFFGEYNGIQLRIKGQDIKREGISPGPEYKDILKNILCRKLDGKLATRKDELDYMRELTDKIKKEK